MITTTKRIGLLPLALLLAFSPGCIVIPIGDLLRGPGLGEQVLVQGGGFFGREKIAIVDIDGLIQGDEGGSLLLSHDNTVSETKAKLNMVRLDHEVRAVVLRVTSPGGEVTACDVIHHELQKFKKDTGLPVVASIGDMGASGGYYVAVAADAIFAHPTSIVGSIGVVLQHLEITGLLEKIGVSVSPVKSGEIKDLNSPFRPMSAEERRILQNLVDSMHRRFVEVVDSGRQGLGRDEVAALADGRVVSGDEAASLKLVDRVGYLADALEEARKRAGIDRPTIVRYTRTPQSAATIYTQSSLPSPSAGVLKLDLAGLGSGPKLYYLWRPGF